MSSTERLTIDCTVSDKEDDISIEDIADDDISNIVEHVVASPKSISTTDIGDIEQHLDQIAQSLVDKDLISEEPMKKYTKDEMHTFSMNMRNYHDMLMFYWYYVFGQRWIRGLMMSDCHYTLNHLNEAITIRESLNDCELGTNELYDAYCDRLESEDDAKFVFGEVNHLIDSDRFFSFHSFAARIMFVLCKFDLYPFYYGQPLPRDFQDWRGVVIAKMQNYMLNVLCLEPTSCHTISIEVLCPEQRPGPYGRESPRHYTWNLMHNNKAYPKVVPIAMDPNSFRMQCPLIQIDMSHPRAVQTLNAFRVQWTNLQYFKWREDLEWAAQARWPRSDQCSYGTWNGTNTDGEDGDNQANGGESSDLKEANAKSNVNGYSPERMVPQYSEDTMRWQSWHQWQQQGQKQQWSRWHHSSYASGQSKRWNNESKIQSMASHRAKHNPYAAECVADRAADRKTDSVSGSEMVRPRVCPIWARTGYCKWGDQCYDVHHAITAYLNEDVEAIMLERAASSDCKTCDLDELSSTDMDPLILEKEPIDAMESLSPPCTFSLSPHSPAESTLNLSISFPSDLLGKEKAFPSVTE